MKKTILQTLSRILRPTNSIDIKDDANIEWMGDQICLTKKNYPVMQDDFREEIIKDTKDAQHKISISIRAIREGLFEVNGVIFNADTPLEAQAKYLRNRKK